MTNIFIEFLFSREYYKLQTHNLVKIFNIDIYKLFIVLNFKWMISDHNLIHFMFRSNSNWEALQANTGTVAAQYWLYQQVCTNIFFCVWRRWWFFKSVNVSKNPLKLEIKFCWIKSPHILSPICFFLYQAIIRNETVFCSSW